MHNSAEANRKNRILMGIYNSSWSTSMITLTIVGALEIFMLIYTVFDPALFGQYMRIYRMFYIALLSAAIIYIALNAYIKKNIADRHRWLNVVNPFYAAFFFAWALGITYFDAVKYGVVDSTVFMTFSLTVPLSFYLFPTVYTLIVVISDALMIYIMAKFSGAVGPLINLSIFIIFQLVLGVSFLRLKMKLGERIVREQENAEIDVLTGFPNRRAYEKEIKRLSEEQPEDDMVYIAIDINELKEVNDHYGHEAGDQLIIGAARCIEQNFGEKGRLYRIGGDEFAVMLSAKQAEMEALFSEYDKSMASWSERNAMALSTACGYACHADHPEAAVTQLARIADKKMYEAKNAYYQENGKDRRRYR